MKVLVANRGDAGAYYRVLEPFTVLNLSTGLDVSFARPPIIQGAANEFDVLWLQMDAGPYAELAANAFKAQGKRVIYDVDDWLPGYPPSWNGYDHYFQRGTGQGTELLKSHWRLLALADVVTTTTPYLAEKLREYCAYVRVLPNCVVQGDWDTLLPASHGLEGVVIGWFGTGNHWEEWYELAPALDVALESIGGYLSIVGAPELVTCFPRRLAARTFVADLVPMADFDNVRKAITSFDIGVAWATERLEASKCRSPLKALQYGAAGTPVFASQTVYGDVIDDSYGFTFLTPQELADGLVTMYGDADVWREIQRRRDLWQAQVWRQHTYETQADLWLDVLEEL